MVSSHWLCHALFLNSLDRYQTELMGCGNCNLTWYFTDWWLVIGDVLVGSLIFFFILLNRVSGDRLLMRQPTLRLGVLIYWIALHALLASFIWTLCVKVSDDFTKHQFNFLLFGSAVCGKLCCACWNMTVLHSCFIYNSCCIAYAPDDNW